MECIAMQNSWKQVDYYYLNDNICIHYACDIISMMLREVFLAQSGCPFFFSFILYHPFSFSFYFILSHLVSSYLIRLCLISFHRISSHFSLFYLCFIFLLSVFSQERVEQKETPLRLESFSQSLQTKVIHLLRLKALYRLWYNLIQFKFKTLMECMRNQGGFQSTLASAHAFSALLLSLLFFLPFPTHLEMYSSHTHFFKVMITGAQF